jgi:phospholipase/carboxylesterase
MMSTNKIHPKSIIKAGKDLKDAEKVLIMLHGRGGSAEDILSLSNHLQLKDYALIAPQANNNSWYPYSFMAPPSQNEPWLSSTLSLLKKMVNDVIAAGIKEENIYFLGFSQGACLTLEFAARNARKFGGVVAFTGGLIGDRIYPGNYKGDFGSTPVFIGTSNPDPHVPVERVYATTNILKSMNANVTEKIYENMGHIINQDEIDLSNKLVFES